MSEKSTSYNGGVGVMGLLGVVFVTMKLIGIEPVASWSWWWVTAPFWGGIALVLVIICIVLLVAVVAAALAGKS